MKNEKLILKEKLLTVRRKAVTGSHIRIKTNACRNCLTHVCARICPAGVYEWDEVKKEITIHYENCLECGACNLACEMHNIEWSNPANGTGVVYIQG